MEIIPGVDSHYGEKQIEALLQARLSDPDPHLRAEAEFGLAEIAARRARRRKIRWGKYAWFPALGLGALLLLGLLLD